MGVQFYNMGWSNPRTWVDGEVPTAAQFNTELRDNLDYLKGNAGEVVFSDYLDMPDPATGHILTHTGTSFKFGNKNWYLPGTVVLHTNGTERNTGISSHPGTLIKETQVWEGGGFSITWEQKSNVGIGGTTKSHVYKNGSVFGTTLHTVLGSGYMQNSETLWGWNSGDLLQIYAYSTGSTVGQCYIQNLIVNVDSIGTGSAIT